MVAVLCGLVPTARAQEAPGDTATEPIVDPVEAEAEASEQEPDVEELSRRLDLLAEEVERLRSGEEPSTALSPADARAIGLAPSAAATYGRGQGVSIAGYGEMLYENFAGENEAGLATGKGTQFDFLRAIIYAGYRFNDKFLFNSEIEVEHADEVFVEFAYVDYQAHEHFGVRGGMLLIPMGLVNEFHEPRSSGRSFRRPGGRTAAASTARSTGWRSAPTWSMGSMERAFRRAVCAVVARRAERPRRATWRSPDVWT